jgi:hypothetical protein
MQNLKNLKNQIMETTTQTDYHATIRVNASAARAAEAISRPDTWWTENFKGRASHLHDVFTVHFGETFVTFRIEELIPDKKIVWRVTDCYLHWLKEDKLEWKNTSVHWEISTSGGSTRIDMTHIGIRPGVECFENCRKGWDQYVQGSLNDLLTKGLGAPAKKS